MNKVKKTLLFSLLLSNAFCMVLKSNFIFDSSLEGFLKFAVDEEDQNGYRSFYSRFLEKQSRSRKHKKQRQLRRLRANALKRVREEKPEWYAAIEPFVFDIDEQTKEARKVRLFLTRFALLDEYHESLKPEEAGWWDNTKRYMKNVGHSIASMKNKALGRKQKEVKA